MPELRKDPVIGRWVIISTERGRRPTSFGPTAPEPRSGFCPFCPGSEDKTPPEVYAVRANGGPPNSTGWMVRVVPNKFPALEIEGSLDRRGEGLYDKMNGVGAHEVVIETPDPMLQLADLPAEQVGELQHRVGCLDDHLVRPDTVHLVVEALTAAVERALDLQRRELVRHH